MTTAAAPGLTRRGLLQAGGAVLALGWWPGAGAAARAGTGSGRVLSAAQAAAAGIELNAWVRIGSDGRVTLTVHRAEMGQGAESVVPQMLAEELEVDPLAVDIVYAAGDGARYGNQVTGGSTTVRGGLDGLLRTGASARELLQRAAAARWGVAASACRAERAAIVHPASGRRLGYGALVADAARLTPASDVALKPRQAWTQIGRALPRRDLPGKVNGSAVYGIDLRLPGQRFAVVERCPRFEGRLRRFDARAALAVPGVQQVLKVERDVFGHRREGVAVVASSTWAALQGRRALVVEWDDADLAGVDSTALQAQMRQALDQPAGQANHYQSKGDFERALAASQARIDAVYETPYQAHACLEPLNCTARFADGRLEVWGPIQGPDWMQQHLATAFQLPPAQVRVQMTLLGGGFGRKAFTDYVHEAASLARALPGTPVQVLWTREDDLALGPFRPGYAYRVRAGAREGRIHALGSLAVGQNMDLQNPGADRSRYNHALVEGLPETYFRSIGHQHFADVPLAAPVPVMWWRSVHASTNAFAYESAIDELAVAARLDPLALRRHMLWDARGPRLLDRLEAVSGWKNRGTVRGYGASLTECFESWVGQVVKVSRRADGRVGIDRVWVVIDCGVAVNPDAVKAQVEGSVVMALGAALTHEVRFEAGRATARNFDRYPLPQLRDVPPIEVHILTNEHKPGGAGEPAVPGFAPALTNAVFDLTGQRIRRLPFSLEHLLDLPQDKAA